MTKTLFPFELRQLLYFSVVAEERNLRRAAERLCLSQPPLSRQIKQLEEDLGLTLFERHTRGLRLTEHGAAVLEKIQPLLDTYACTCAELEGLGACAGRMRRVGLTTAFEQGVFAPLEQGLTASMPGTRFVRHDSPRLVRELARGRLDLAFVALPLATEGLPWASLGYREPCVLALPAGWPEAALEPLALSALNNSPLFWFHREANPAFFDSLRAVFSGLACTPIFLEEPPEHDVLLARIAAGEAAGLFAASFAVIQRPGVVFRSFREADLVGLELGLVAGNGQEALLERIASWAAARLRRQSPNFR